MIIIWPTAKFFGAFDYGMHILVGIVVGVCEKEAKRKARIEGSTHRCGLFGLFRVFYFYCVTQSVKFLPAV